MTNYQSLFFLMRIPGHHLTMDVLLIINKAQKLGAKRGNRCEPTLHRTAGHGENEIADSEAEGLTSNKQSLPPYMRKKAA